MTLEIEGLHASYGSSIVALRDVTLRVASGSIVALLGANGAGKTTTLRAISGMLKSEGGSLRSGRIAIDGVPIHDCQPYQIVGRGVVQVPEGRQLFAELSVEDNLHTGACRRPMNEAKETLADVYDRFPRLRERRTVAAGYLSGGEQQMVAIGRALMARPRLLLLDEPSLGLAPQIVHQIFEALVDLKLSRKLTVLLVEQNAAKALSIADHGFVLQNGRIALQGPRDELLRNDEIRKLYLGLSETGERRSMRQPFAPKMPA